MFRWVVTVVGKGLGYRMLNAAEVQFKSAHISTCSVPICLSLAWEAECGPSLSVVLSDHTSHKNTHYTDLHLHTPTPTPQMGVG